MKTYTVEEQLRADMFNVAYRAKHEHRAWQNVPELAEVLYLVASEPGPVDVVVEVGCAWGGTLWAWRQLPSDPAVYGITLGHFGLPPERPGQAVMVRDSHDPATVDALRDNIGVVDTIRGALDALRDNTRVVDTIPGAGRDRPVDVLFIDGDHTYDGCLADWRMYSPLVRPGGLILLHDIRCAGEEAVARVWEDVIKPEAHASGWHTQEIVAKAGKPLGFGIVRMAGEQA